MNVGPPPPNFANAVSPFSPIGKQAVSEENTESKFSSFKSIEESADSSRSENRNKKHDPDRLIERAVASPLENNEQKKQQRSAEETDEVDSTKAQQKQRLDDQEQEIIRELSARDREVRNHERAHAAVGGQYAGAPTYTYKRGPDGINYAVGGEVSISTGSVPGNPEATIIKAQLIKRAALAPANPSPQDRRVAAGATQMEAQARSELLVESQAQLQAEREERAVRQAESKAVTDAQNDSGVTESSTEKAPSKNYNLSQRLIDIGVEISPNPSGSVISDSA
jgi:hypothetical protein